MRCPVCECPAERLFFRDGSLDCWRCDSCAATFLEPGRLPSAETERAHYRLYYNEPDDEGYRQFLARLAPPPHERLPPAQHGLTYGYGPGPVLAGLLRKAGHTMALYAPRSSTTIRLRSTGAATSSPAPRWPSISTIWRRSSRDWVAC